MTLPLMGQESGYGLRPMGPQGLLDGGTYHVATGTWNRDALAPALLGPDVIYNNTAHTGVWFSGGIELETQAFAIWDFARVPLQPGVPGSAEYNINGLEISYCLEDDSLATGPLDMEFTLASLTAPCDPEACMQASYLVTNLPGADPVLSGQGLPTCWTITIDLSGGAEFCMPAEGDSVWDQDLDLDSMAIALSFDPDGAGGYVGSIAVGPVVAGDRNWTAKSGLEWTAAGGGGGGTVYGPAESCVPILPARNSSGLDNLDGWWISDRSVQGLPAGCYNLGGYDNVAGCNADGMWDGTYDPPASFYAVLFEDPSVAASCSCPPDDFSICDPAQPNSLGLSAQLSLESHAGPGTGWRLNLFGGRPGYFGYYLVGTAPETLNPIQVSQGLLCLSVTPPEQIGRYNVGVGPLNSIGQFDSAMQFVNLLGSSGSGFGFDIPQTLPFVGSPTIQSGQTYYFQAWYRDLCAFPCSNFSNGIGVTF